MDLLRNLSSWFSWRGNGIQKTSPKNLSELLQQVSSFSSPTASVSFYSPGNAIETEKSLSYPELLMVVQYKARCLQKLRTIPTNHVVLLHFDQHYDGVVWFWAAILAGFLPAISTPFSNDSNHRKKHILHLQKLLENPLILTTEDLLPQFLGLPNLKLKTIEKVIAEGCVPEAVFPGFARQLDDVAVLMLTSGSTGDAKAVSLRNGQILQAIEGKKAYHGTTTNSVFLNWIGLDHVANLAEIHLHALSLGASQIHVQATDIIADPLAFLELIEKHQVSYTFAPNFFLASLKRAIEDGPNSTPQRTFNLASLKLLISGGEAVVVDTAITLSKYFSQQGTIGEVIRPGFGMTETCAGIIYSKACPSYDIESKYQFANLGNCIPGVAMRVVVGSSDPANSTRQASTGEIGHLQLSGALVFREYFNNSEATLKAFTKDGWFITGDNAFLDSAGNLNIGGRAKDDIIINGVHYSPTSLETALEEAAIPGVTPFYTVAFGHRPKDSQTEALCVAYLPRHGRDDAQARVEVVRAIRTTSVLVYGIRPFKILPLEKKDFNKSALGKLSRTKIQKAFEQGKYDTLEEEHRRVLATYRSSETIKPLSQTEETILSILQDNFPTDEIGLSLDTSLFDIGVTSVELIRFKHLLEKTLSADISLSLSLILANPTVQSMAHAIDTLESFKAYDPVVTLQPNGEKIPLWLVHPGVGEVLIFINLANYIKDRPLYALRARGFNAGEAYFTSIPEIISTYLEHMRARQPKGPYAIAGYSFGSMIAFEISKQLEASGEEVKFLGSFNLPPHIKARMQQLDTIETMLNLSYFLGLSSEEWVKENSSAMHQLTYDAALDHVLSLAPPERLEELSLDKGKLQNWSSLASAMQYAAREYDPSGSVAGIDVFHAIPLASLGQTKQEWLHKQLYRWADFSRSEPRYHDVDGAHYTMLSPEHVHTFQKTLKKAMTGRGV